MSSYLHGRQTKNEDRMLYNYLGKIRNQYNKEDIIIE